MDVGGTSSVGAGGGVELSKGRGVADAVGEGREVFVAEAVGVGKTVWVGSAVGEGVLDAEISFETTVFAAILSPAQALENSAIVKKMVSNRQFPCIS